MYRMEIKLGNSPWEYYYETLSPDNMERELHNYMGRRVIRDDCVVTRTNDNEWHIVFAKPELIHENRAIRVLVVADKRDV